MHRLSVWILLHRGLGVYDSQELRNSFCSPNNPKLVVNHTVAVFVCNYFTQFFHLALITNRFLSSFFLFASRVQSYFFIDIDINQTHFNLSCQIQRRFFSFSQTRRYTKNHLFHTKNLSRTAISCLTSVENGLLITHGLD